MKYLVMETHLSYAVVLDDTGRFIKCANQNFQVGQRVAHIVAMALPEQPVQPGILERLRRFFWVPALAGAMALVLVVASLIGHYTTFASVYLAINPEVRIDINRNETVIGLAGTNDDGQQLIAGYQYKKKTFDTVLNELIDRAIEQGFLSDGGKVSIDLATQDAEWQAKTGPQVRQNIQSHLKDKLTIRLRIDGDDPDENKYIIPLPRPQSPYDDNQYDDSPYESDDDDSPYETDDDDAPAPIPWQAPDDDSDYEWDDSEYDD